MLWGRRLIDLWRWNEIKEFLKWRLISKSMWHSYSVQSFIALQDIQILFYIQHDYWSSEIVNSEVSSLAKLYWYVDFFSLIKLSIVSLLSSDFDSSLSDFKLCAEISIELLFAIEEEKDHCSIKRKFDSVISEHSAWFCNLYTFLLQEFYRLNVSKCVQML